MIKKSQNVIDMEIFLIWTLKVWRLFPEMKQTSGYVGVWDPGVIWGQFFKVCFMQKKNIFLVFCHLPICIISLMNAQKHVFGMYVFVYLVICVSKNQGLQWLTLSHYKCVQFSIFAVTSPHSQQSLVHTPNSHLTILPKVNCYQKSHSFNSILICFMFFPT